MSDLTIPTLSTNPRISKKVLEFTNPNQTNQPNQQPNGEPNGDRTVQLESVQLESGSESVSSDLPWSDADIPNFTPNFPNPVEPDGSGTPSKRGRKANKRRASGAGEISNHPPASATQGSDISAVPIHDPGPTSSINPESPQSPQSPEPTTSVSGADPFLDLTSLLPRLLALLESTHSFAIDHPLTTQDPFLYRFVPTPHGGGTYLPCTDMWLITQIRNLLGPALIGHYSSSLLSGLTDLLRASKPHLHLEPPSNSISLANGLLLLNEQIGESKVAIPIPNSPSPLEVTYPIFKLIPTPTTHLSTVQLPIHYAPGLIPQGTTPIPVKGQILSPTPLTPTSSTSNPASASGQGNSPSNLPSWITFLTSIFPSDSLELALEILGAPLSSSRSIQESIWLYGPGGNGKSTFLSALQLMVGRDNSTSIPLSSLTSNRFSLIHVRNKLLYIDPDAPTKAIEHSHVFKSIISGDMMYADQKYRSAINFAPFCKVVLASNECPSSPDRSIGFMRRIVMVPFIGFDSTRSTTIRHHQDDILQSLSSQPALSSMLNLALSGLTSLLRNKRYTKPDTVADATSAWTDAHTPPVERFLEEIVQETPFLNQKHYPHDPDKVMLKSDLYILFKEWCRRRYPSTYRQISQLSYLSFWHWVARFRPEWKDFRFSELPGRPRGFYGIEFTTAFYLEFPDGIASVTKNNQVLGA